MMLRTDVQARLSAAVQELCSTGVLPPGEYSCEISESKGPGHGDFATNFALLAQKAAGKSPREVAAPLARLLLQDSTFAKVEIAGPGFINLTLSNDYLVEWALRGKNAGDEIAKSQRESPKKILVEFVSVNPNGPIHCGHGRGAAYGDTLTRALRAAGDEVSSEYYVNDGVNSLQMQLFAASARARYLEILGHSFDFPEDGYKGEYVYEIAKLMQERHGGGLLDKDLEFWQRETEAVMQKQQEEDLRRFGVVFDSWFSEQSLHDSGEVSRDIEELKLKGILYEKDGALFLRSTDYGDDKDRVVVRNDGRPTYLASDIAYHRNKFERGFDHLIDVWGADHHGYIARTRAAVQGFGYAPNQFEAIITQIVRFYEDGKLVEMSKRDGTMVTLVELMDQVGEDVARFFYLTRSHDAHMDFDLDLAREQGDKNPVYYVQYAHARICSLLTRAAEQGFGAEITKLTSLDAPERDLILKVWDLPYEVRRAADDRGVHRLTTYAMELARQYHDFYEKCRVIDPENQDRTAGRLALCELTRTALRANFDLLGISAPERM